MNQAIDSIGISIETAANYHRSGRLVEAERIYRSVLARQPGHLDANYLLGLIELERGKPAVATGLIAQARQGMPHNPLYQYNLGRALEACGDLPQAETCYRKAVQLQADYADARLALGCLLQQQGRLQDAVREYRWLLKRTPDNPSVLNNLGNALSGLGRMSEAEQALRRSVALAPGYAQGFGNLGNLLMGLGQTDEADEAFRKALELAPGEPDFHYNYGNYLQLVCRYDEAVASYQRALELRPRMAGAANNLGNVLKLLGRIEEAEAVFRQAIAADPDYPDAYNNLGNVMVSNGEIELAIGWYRTALDKRPNFVDAYSNLVYALNYPIGLHEQDLFREHREWSLRFERPLLTPQAQAAPARPLTGRKLRLGYVSGDFRRHSVAFFFEPLLKAHDRDRVEVFCYSNVIQADDVTARIQAQADGWRSIAGLSDEAAAAQIRADRIDLLVDLSGHTDGNRLLVFARRPAPLQVSWLGYPNTTGLESMQFRLTDAICDPEGETDRFHAERLIRLPEGFLCYEGYEAAPEVREPPCLHGAPVTFGSFNNLTKVTRPVVDQWCRIMQAVPGSRIILKTNQLEDPRLRDKYRGWFADNGVSADRVELLARIPGLTEHLELYSRLDIALDCFPYNGTTTTCEALWMGVPVLTLDGGSHRARVSKSILHRLGLDHLAAADGPAMVRLAQQLAGDPQALRSLRLGMRERMRGGPLCDAPRFAASLEHAFEVLFRAVAGPAE